MNDDLAVLRDQAGKSYAWWKGTQRLSDKGYAALTDKQQTGWSWHADMRIVDQLCAAERAESAAALERIDARAH